MIKKIGNKIGFRCDPRKLEKALKSNSSLTELHLNGCGMEDYADTIYQTLKSNTTLTTLSIS